MENLVINVEQIEEPRQLEERALSKAFLEEIFADAPTYHPEHGATFKAHLTRVGERDVLLEGSTTIAVKSECRRCLTDVVTELPAVFTLNLIARAPEPTVPKGKGKKKPAAEESEEFESVDETMPDEELFDGEKIDLAPILREQLLLALPSIEPLCKEACKGLCTTCGQDLNVKDCGHSQKIVDPRWSGLKDLKI